MTKQEIIERISSVLQSHPEVAAMEIYGSVARGEHNEDSDVDLIVEYDLEAVEKGDQRILSLDDDIEHALGRRVSIAEKTMLARSKARIFPSLIANERELIYEKA